MGKYLFELNKEQKEAVLKTEGPLLILAGAGSGKTKTIISRTIHILKTRPVHADNILVMTFTNKAAREMKERGSKLINGGIMPEFTTFHSWGVRFLKSVSDNILFDLEINSKFSIMDSKEQEKIIDNLKYNVFNEEFANEFKSAKFALTLGNLQNNFTRYDSKENALIDINELYSRNLVNIYCPSISDITPEYLENLADLFYMYKKELRANNSIDFEDLINLPVKILYKYKEIRNAIKNKYKYLMVDEFQDTNGSQYKLLNLMLNEEKNICVVGDDSQSIYGWRGAKISYIINFANDFNNCKVVNLSKNYRSRQSIVEKANGLLKHAVERHSDKKDLISNSEKQGTIKAFRFSTDYEEASFIAKQISSLIRRGSNPGNITILYRSAFLSRLLEAELIKNRVPYNIHNGKTLLSRVIPRAVISYLKALKNKDNSLAFSILFELSGLLTGKRASDFYLSIEENENMYLYLKNGNYKKQPRISKKLIEKIDSFLIEFDRFYEMNFEDFKESFMTDNFLYKMISIDLESEKESKRIKAMSNLNALSLMCEIISQYKSLDSLLETLLLEGEVDDAVEDKVNLMTIHASKGLEFDCVFLMGAVNGMFPSKNTENLEEERRLFYVAITRAKNSMILTCPDTYLADDRFTPSQFVEEASIQIKDMRKEKGGFFREKTFY